jgi:hypothetical protein
MKRWFMKFAVSKTGVVAIPLLTALIASGLAKLAALSPELAAEVDPGEVAAWIWGVLLAVVLSYVNKTQGDGVVRIQHAMDVTPVVQGVTEDRYAGPRLYAEVRRAISVAERNNPLQQAFGNPDEPAPKRPARKKAGWWK